MVRNWRWVALPTALTITVVVLIGFRIRIVLQRQDDWLGEGCVVGPYNPAERTYLYVITAVFVMAVASALMVAIKTRSRSARWTAVGLLIFCAVVAVYLLYVWGGLEINNQPKPELPCPTLKERQA